MAEQQVEQAPLSPVKPVKDEIAELTEQMQDVVIVEEEKPMLLSEEEAKAEPIKVRSIQLFATEGTVSYEYHHRRPDRSSKSKHPIGLLNKIPS